MNSLENYLYQWPTSELSEKAGWKESKQKNFNEFIMPESEKDLAEDSKWPGFFPSSICFVTTSDGKVDVLEKVVGANIVNRFPYTIALSFCSKSLSKRHYSREKFMSALEKGNSASINFFEPGKELDLCMEAISEIPDQKSETRIEYTNLKTRNAITNNSKVFEDAYLVYEAKLVKPG